MVAACSAAALLSLAERRHTSAPASMSSPPLAIRQSGSALSPETSMPAVMVIKPAGPGPAMSMSPSLAAFAATYIFSVLQRVTSFLCAAPRKIDARPRARGGGRVRAGASRRGAACCVARSEPSSPAARRPRLVKSRAPGGLRGCKGDLSRKQSRWTALGLRRRILH
eukprot:SAG22_NODE_1472_length_4342_cov_3.211171_1_plen_167_part_00